MAPCPNPPVEPLPEHADMGQLILWINDVLAEYHQCRRRHDALIEFNQKQPAS